MRLLSWNVNGIRAVFRHGFLKFLREFDADVLCLQEIKASPDQLAGDIELRQLLEPYGYRSYWHPAEKKGYSGTATYSRLEPKRVQNGIGIAEFDQEGRVLVTEYPEWVLLNCYFPNAQRDHARLDYKLRFCDAILKFCEQIRTSGKEVVICGDLNIAHRPIDLRNPKSNEKNSGFLPEERAWMDQFLSGPYVDVFRQRVQEPHHYTWWSYRPGVREKNVGWRIDYHIVSQNLADRVRGVGHLPEVMGSDHCPVWLEIGAR